MYNPWSIVKCVICLYEFLKHTEQEEQMWSMCDPVTNSYGIRWVETGFIQYNVFGYFGRCPIISRNSLLTSAPIPVSRNPEYMLTSLCTLFLLWHHTVDAVTGRTRRSAITHLFRFNELVAPKALTHRLIKSKGGRVNTREQIETSSQWGQDIWGCHFRASV